MSYAYMALFTGDYIRDTRHLSCSEHGCYLMLLIHCWDTRGPAPLDERKQQGICNARSTDEIEAMRRVLAEFFVRMDDGYYNPRMQREIEKVQALSRTWSEAGKRGAEARLRVLSAKAKRRARVGQAEASTPSSSSSLSPTPKSEALAPTPTGIDAASPVITIPLNDKTEFPISADMVREWSALYPECDIEQTLREIRGWNLANPSKRKTRAGVINHVNRWLAKEQNRG